MGDARERVQKDPSWVGLSQAGPRWHWYPSYCAAMLDANQDTALSNIETCQKVMQDRLAVIRLTASSSPREIDDLKRALDNLTMRLCGSRNGAGGIVWD